MDVMHACLSGKHVVSDVVVVIGHVLRVYRMSTRGRNFYSEEGRKVRCRHSFHIRSRENERSEEGAREALSVREGGSCDIR